MHADSGMIIRIYGRDNTNNRRSQVLGHWIDGRYNTKGRRANIIQRGRTVDVLWALLISSICEYHFVSLLAHAHSFEHTRQATDGMAALETIHLSLDFGHQPGMLSCS